MKRKIFSKLLMGALLVASVSSFVSCKDYDDDINTINEKLATLALQSTVDNLQSQLQQAISAAQAAQSTADQAVKAAAAAQSTADAAATKAALAEVDAAAKAAGEEAAKAITNAATAQTAAEAAQKTADEAAAAAKAAQAAADAAAAAAASGSDAAKAEAAAAKAAAEVAQAAADAAAKAAADNKSAVEAAAAVAAEAKKAAADAAAVAATAAGKEVDLSDYVTTKALEEALKDYAKATNDYVTKAQLNDELKTIKEQLEKVNKGFEKLEALGDLEVLAQTIDGYKKSIDQFFKALTHVEVFASLSNGLSNGGADLQYVALPAIVGQVSANSTFGKKEVTAAGNYSASSTVSYAKNTLIEVPTELIVRVNPVDATFDAENVRLQDSKGNDLSAFLKASKVEKYNDLLKTRAVETGLWKIKFVPKNTQAKINAQTIDGGANKLYAVAINNTDSAATRYVASSYDITVTADAYTPATSLDNVHVYTEVSDPDDANHTLATGNYDGRDETVGNILYAAQGEKIYVDFSKVIAGTAPNKYANVDKWYVVRDDNYAVTSDGGDAGTGTSEINAWKLYKYTGLNTIYDVKDGKKAITVTGLPEAGDEIAFRVFAVNFDGTLVDADGEGFVVYIGGSQGAEGTTITGKFTAGIDNVNNILIPFTPTRKQGVIDNPTTVTVKNGNASYSVEVSLVDGNNNPTTVWNNVKKAKVKVITDLTTWKDGATATGSFKLTESGSSVVVNTISVSLTKVMPTAFPATFKWKDNQLVGNKFTSYIYPTGDDWTTAATTGHMQFSDAITGLDNNYRFTIGTAALDADGAYTKNLVNTTGTDYDITVPKALIGTEHALNIDYVYYNISSDTDDNNWPITGESRTIEFANPVALTKFSAWNNWYSGTKGEITHVPNQITYETPSSLDLESGKDITDYIFTTNTYDSDFAGKLSELISGARQKYVTVKSVKLTSNGSGNEDYFTVDKTTFAFTEVAGSKNPTADVNSTLTIVLTDAYGKDHTIAAPFVVKKR